MDASQSPASADSSLTMALTPVQRERLLALRAEWEEGEDEEHLQALRRREEDLEALKSIARLLAETGLAQGGVLSYAEMARLLALVRLLAPNPNLDARLLRRAGEPEALNQDLRDLLYGAGSGALRLRQFLTRRHAGAQTALQLLCAASPTEWPLITPAGLRTLDLSPEQRAIARHAARARFDLPPDPLLPDSDPILRLLADTLLYEAAREILAAPDYLLVHRMLTGRWATGRTLAWEGNGPEGSRFPQASAQGEERIREGERPAYASRSASSLPEPSPPTSLPPPADLTGLFHRDLMAQIEREIAAEGFTYTSLIVRDYYIALQTKPLALLAGLSGAGKSRLTSLFAQAMTGSGAQYRLLPVRPDWTDATPLLGYVNLLADGGRGRIVSTQCLDFLRLAARPENASRAFFLCLDEMNLARVEHYFADLLSALETPNRELLLPGGSALSLPANLFFSGTLNLDEATHSLSRKVLDRANTLIFREVSLREEPAAAENDAHPSSLTYEQRQALFLLGRVQTVAEARARLRSLGQADFATQVVERLAEANGLLEPYDLQFGYRIRDEALRYCANSFDRDGQGLLTPEAPRDLEVNLRLALDLQLLQRALPRLTGTQEQIEPPARDLLRWAKRAKFLRTAQRLERLLVRLQRDGFIGLE